MVAVMRAVAEDRADNLYRFSVRCDRATNAKIEAAARKVGMSATAYVQRHFDSILDARPNPQKLDAFDAATFDAISFSKRHQVTLLAARLWANLRVHAGPQGDVQRYQTLLAQDVGCDHASTGRLISTLVDAGLLEIVRSGKAGQSPVYRVLGEG